MVCTLHLRKNALIVPGSYKRETIDILNIFSIFSVSLLNDRSMHAAPIVDRCFLAVFVVKWDCY